MTTQVVNIRPTEAESLHIRGLLDEVMSKNSAITEQKLFENASAARDFP